MARGILLPRTPTTKNVGVANSKTGAPQGVPAITPTLFVDNVQHAVEFYTQLGFKLGTTIPGPNGGWTSAELCLGNNRVLLYNKNSPLNAYGPWKGQAGYGFALYVYVPDCDRTYAQCVDASVNIETVPHDEFWGDRCFTIRDPYGFTWTFATHVKDLTHDEIVEAAWNH